MLEYMLIIGVLVMYYIIKNNIITLDLIGCQI